MGTEISKYKEQTEVMPPICWVVGDIEGEEEIREDFLVWDLTHKKQSKFCGKGEEFSFGHVEQDTHVEISHKMLEVWVGESLELRMLKH